MIYIGIVGSRKRSEISRIREILRHLLLFTNDTDREITLVSGGAKGIDTEAETIAKELGMATLIYRPKMEEYSVKGNSIYFERNKLIAKRSDYLYAFPLGNKGGTWNTINHFKRLYGKDTPRLIIIK